MANIQGIYYDLADLSTDEIRKLYLDLLIKEITTYDKELTINQTVNKISNTMERLPAHNFIMATDYFLDPNSIFKAAQINVNYIADLLPDLTIGQGSSFEISLLDYAKNYIYTDTIYDIMADNVEYYNYGISKYIYGNPLLISGINKVEEKFKDAYSEFGPVNVKHFSLKEVAKAYGWLTLNYTVTNINDIAEFTGFDPTLVTNLIEIVAVIKSAIESSSDLASSTIDDEKYDNFFGVLGSSLGVIATSIEILSKNSKYSDAFKAGGMLADLLSAGVQTSSSISAISKIISNKDELIAKGLPSDMVRLIKNTGVAQLISAVGSIVTTVVKQLPSAEVKGVSLVAGLGGQIVNNRIMAAQKATRINNALTESKENAIYKSYVMQAQVQSELLMINFLEAAPCVGKK